jgi:predicted phosphodiesterase
VSRTLFVGDVHSCADELSALLNMVQPERVILLGDVFNKGPKPEETWSLVQEWSAEAVLGNHDVAVIAAFERGDVRAPPGAVAWLKQLPFTLEGPSWIAVHGGIDPVHGVEHTTREQAISMRRWPSDEAHNSHWWKQYRGDKLVVYGHDAVMGLQDHRPYTIGLDSGCVYGKALTGYLLEADEVVGVRANAIYRPTG